MAQTKIALVIKKIDARGNTVHQSARDGHICVQPTPIRADNYGGIRDISVARYHIMKLNNQDAHPGTKYYKSGTPVSLESHCDEQKQGA
jgi:hypothetical protein